MGMASPLVRDCLRVPASFSGKIVTFAAAIGFGENTFTACISSSGVGQGPRSSCTETRPRRDVIVPVNREVLQRSVFLAVDGRLASPENQTLAASDADAPKLCADRRNQATKGKTCLMVHKIF